MNAIRRETREVEAQLDSANTQYADISEELRLRTQERQNAEEELMASNVRLKQLLGELQASRAGASQQSEATQHGSRMTMGELTRKVETVLMSVLDERFRDEAFTSAITEQSSLSAVDKVRVEFENDEVYWALQDNYSFEMLLQDAARYWDVAAQDVILVDERGAIWPNDAYVQLEIQRNPTLKIVLKIKPVAVQVDDDIEMYGREGEEESDDDDGEDSNVLAIAAAAEDELLLAQAKGTAANLTVKQKLALRRKLKFELYYFVAFVIVFIWGMYGRRTVKDAFRLQDAVATAFTDENFGDYNEKTYLDIATTEEMFEWMGGPLMDGLFPDTLYNDQPVPPSRRGYVMTYNKIVGKIRLRQLRVAPDASCRLSRDVKQVDTTRSGNIRHRQFVDHCFGRYSFAGRSNASFGPRSLHSPGSGFVYSDARANNLEGVTIGGKAGSYDGSGFVRDLDAINRSAYIEALESLRTNLWVDELTRAVIISLNLYNGNYNYYCVSQFMLEFSQGGTVIPTANNRILRIDLYELSSLQDIGVIFSLYVPEILTALGSLAYVLHFFYRLYRVKKVTKAFANLFKGDIWIFVDMLLFATLIGTNALRWLYYFSAARVEFAPFNEVKGGSYKEMSGLAAEYSFVFVIEAFTVLVLVVKSLKYFQLQKDLMLLQKTLGQAIADLGVFLGMLAILFAGFVIMGLNIFGMQARGFKSLLDTLGTLFLILLGEFDFEEMREVSNLWSLTFFIFFVIFMFFIVLNIFLAILNDAYTTVRANAVWDELERRKPLSLREKFEVRKAQWRERKNINRMKRVKKEKIKAARKAKKELEKRSATRGLLDPIRRQKRKAAESEMRGAMGDGGNATSSTRDEPGKRKAHVKDHPF